MRILAVHGLAVNSLAVNGALPLYVESKSVLYTQYSVKKCLVHFMKRRTRSPCFPRFARGLLGRGHAPPGGGGPRGVVPGCGEPAMERSGVGCSSSI